MSNKAGKWSLGGSAHTAIVELLSDGKARSALEMVRAKPELSSAMIYELLDAMTQNGVLESYREKKARRLEVAYYRIRSETA